MDTLFEKIFLVLVSSGLRYFLFAGIPFVIFYVLFSKKYKKNKIQNKSSKKYAFTEEIKNSILTIGVISSMVSLVLFTPFRAVSLIYEDINQFSLVWIPVSIMLCIVLHDAYFYWLHRIVHHVKIYKYVHKTHHKSTNPSPWTSYSFDILEAILENLILVLLIFIIPLHPLALMIFGLLSFTINVYGHLGYEIMPNWFRNSFLFKHINTSVYHNLHHKEFNNNYSLYFRWWDNWFGTNNPNYEKEYDIIQERRFSDTNTSKISILKTATFIVLLGVAVSSFKSSVPSIINNGHLQAMSITGKWLSVGENGKAIVEIFKATNGKYYGRYIKAIKEEDHLKIDSAMKKKGMVVLYVLKSFEYLGDNTWGKGTLFSFKRKQDLKGDLKLLKDGNIEVTGYYMGFSKTFYWIKINE